LAIIQLLQLPVPPPSYYAATGNVPLAAASLASSLSYKETPIKNLTATSVAPEITDNMGDTELVDFLLESNPDYVGFSLYLWNTERSLHLARELKKQKSDITILIGGPEVNADNPFLMEQLGYDIAVSGEAEHSFGKLMKSLVEKSPLSSVENISYRLPNGKMSEFTHNVSADFPLTDFPSPYTSGFLSVDGARSTYLETVRGCKSQCTYCFYPKSSQNLRTLNIDETVKLISHLKESGARELVFLDPTFNHRPGFENFLDAIAEVNSDHQMSMFAELRSEGVTSKIAKKLAKAGFNRIELGMQSINPETLKRVKRYGDPEKVAEVSKMLVGEGIELLLDLIIGLPGDKPSDVERGIHFFLEHGLEEWVQVFPLSVLPGTAMRRDAKKEGLIFLQSPPYRIISTADFSEQDISSTLELAESLLDRRVDEFPRPFLCNGASDINDHFHINFSNLNPDQIQKVISQPGSRHQAIWFESKDWAKDLNLMQMCIEKRIGIDPYCTMDFVFYTETMISDAIIQKVQKIIDEAPQSYLSRVLAHRNENMQRRIIVICKKDADLPKLWISNMEKNENIFFYLEMDKSSLPDNLNQIGIDMPLVWFQDREVSESLWKSMKENIDPEAISFGERYLEKRWSIEVLGYGEV